MAESRPGATTLLGLGVAAVTLAVFLPGLAGGYVFDDLPLVLHNPRTTSLAGIPDLFVGDLWQGVPGHTADASEGYYRPLFLVSLALDRALGDGVGWIAHLHSVAWHLLACGLLHRLLGALLRDPLAALAGVALFAVHPVQIEGVQWIAARNDPMAAALLLGALLVLEGARGQRAPSTGGGGGPAPQPGGDPSPARLGAAAALCFAAMLCKESVVIAPVAWAALSRVSGRGWGGVRAHLALVLGIVGAVLLRRWAGVGAPGLDLDAVSAVVPTVLSVDAARLLTPHLLPPVVYAESGLGSHLGAGVALAAVLLGLALAGGRPALAGLGLAAVAAAPSLVTVARTGEIAGRYLYLPMAFLALALAAALRGRRAAGPVAGVLVVGLGLVSSQLLVRWRDDETLWSTTATLAPSPRTWGGYAKALQLQGRLDEAATWYRRATTAARPDPFSCFNVTSVNVERGDMQAAADDGLAALRAGCAPSPELVAPLALALAVLGRWDEAEAQAAAVAADPTGKAVVVRIAAAARRGDVGPFDAAVGTGDPERLLQMVCAVLGAGGAEPACAALRAHVSGAPAGDPPG